MIKHMYLTILTIKQLQHENVVQSIKTINKFTKCPLYIYICSDDAPPIVIEPHLFNICSLSAGGLPKISYTFVTLTKSHVHLCYPTKLSSTSKKEKC